VTEDHEGGQCLVGYNSTRFDLPVVRTILAGIDPYAVAQAVSQLASGLAQHALVVGSDTLTKVIDPDDRGTCILFGDGAAGPVVVAAALLAALAVAMARRVITGRTLTAEA